MSTKKRTLGDFLKNHRLGEDMTQVEFAKFLGISKQRLCDLEHDRNNVSIQLCKALAKKLKLPPEWLVKLSLQHQFEKEGLDIKVS